MRFFHFIIFRVLHIEYNHETVMDMIFIIPTFALILFCLARFVEMKFVDKKMKPLKVLIRDCVIFFACVLISNIACSNMGGSIKNFFNVITDAKTLSIDGGGGTEVFTDTPNF